MFPHLKGHCCDGRIILQIQKRNTGPVRKDNFERIPGKIRETVHTDDHYAVVFRSDGRCGNRAWFRGGATPYIGHG